jgi:hypothetical protein
LDFAADRVAAKAITSKMTPIGANSRVNQSACTGVMTDLLVCFSYRRWFQE